MSAPRTIRPRHHGRRYRVREFVRRLWQKSDDDDVFFMAGAISFNVLIALVPLLVLGVGLTGFVLSARFADPTAAVVAFVADSLPAAGVDLSGLLSSLVADVVAQRAGFTILGLLVFIMLAARLAGSLRTALREIFDISSRRGILSGKLFDVGAVVVGVVLLTLNLGVTAVVTTVMHSGIAVLGLPEGGLSLADRILGIVVALLSIWVLFVIAYRYLPARRVGWRTASIAATFAAIGHELLKLAFSWYATEVADYGSTFGNLATVAVLFFWIYYGALVFILGGEVAQVASMRKASRVGVATFEARP